MHSLSLTLSLSLVLKGYRSMKLTENQTQPFLFFTNRQQRLDQMRQAMSEDKFGEIQHIYKTDFIREVSDASKDVWVVAFLYKESYVICRVKVVSCCVAF